MLGYLLARANGAGQQWRGAVVLEVFYWRVYFLWAIG